MEFHVGRDRNYFTNAYTHTYIDNFGVPQNDIVEMPVYTSSSNAPHMKIDLNGNVGIHTSLIPDMTYTARYSVPLYNTVTQQYENSVYLGDKSETPIFYTEGTMYAKNIIMNDIETNIPTSLDALYVRRMGATIEASQIIPGAFALGKYEFLSNVGINGLADDTYSLKVYGSVEITSNLYIDAFTNLSDTRLNTLTVLGTAGFSNDAYFERDVHLKETLKLRAGIWTEVLDVNSTNGYSWCQIQFMVASPTLSNINYIGQGLSTPGRLGVGIDPYNALDAINHQMVVSKRAADIFQVELRDRSIIGLTRALYIGHPDNSQFHTDGSVVFATPTALDTRYNLIQTSGYGVKQNMYFYPGTDFTLSGGMTLTSNVPPVLAIFANPPESNDLNGTKNRQTGSVGIGTYKAIHSLHVEGSIYSASNIYIKDTETDEIVKLGIWKSINTADPGYTNTNLYINSIVYYNPSAPYVGINTLADSRYGLNVAGGFKSINGIYTVDNKLAALWYDSPVSVASNLYGIGLYTKGLIGIGVTVPETSVDIKSLNNKSRIRIRASDYSDTSSYDFLNPTTHWNIETSKTYGSLYVYDASVGASNANLGGIKSIWTGINQSSGKYQVAIGCSETDRFASPRPTAALLVNGELSVSGNVYTYGSYYANGQIALNASTASNIPVLDKNDVYIGGSDIYINPSSTGIGDTYAQRILAVGYNDTLRNLQANLTSIFRVYAQSDVIARFSSGNSTGMIQITDYYGTKGIQLGYQTNSDFGFLDMSGNPYISFVNTQYDANLNVIADKKVGINTSVPTAISHIYTGFSGQDMMKLTKFTLADQPVIGPEIALEKAVSINNNSSVENYSWIIHGPEAGYSQKCSFLYSSPTESRTELMCLTSSGCLGVGNTMPEYGVDIKGVGEKGSIRLFSTYDSLNVVAPAPQLIIQSGDPVFGADKLTDYRIYSFNSNFTIESQSLNSTKTILYVDDLNHVGIGTTVVTDEHGINYALTVGGNLNVQDTIYLNGTAIFTTTGGNNNISGTNITINPDTSVYGGVQINNPSLIQTSNLFTVYSGNDSVTGVFDSLFGECQIALRNTNINTFARPVYRLTSVDNVFELEYNPSITNQTITSSHTGYGTCYTVTPLPSGINDFVFNVNGNITISPTVTNRVPKLQLNTSIIRDTNGQLSFYSSNVGIGTIAPKASLEVNSAYTSNANVYQDIFKVANNTDVFMNVSYDGHVRTSNLNVGGVFTTESISVFQGDVDILSNAVVENNLRVRGLFTNDSDRRLKTDFQKITGALEKVCTLSGYTYEPLDLDKTNKPNTNKVRRMGLIAQEVQQVFPEAVCENDDGYLSIAYGNLMGCMVEAIKELNMKLDSVI